MSAIYTPHPYQARAIQFLQDTPSGALFLDPGMGKTSITLTALADLIDRFEVGKALIVAPLRVVQSVWRQEAAKWDHLRRLTFSAVLGSPKQREAALARPADIYLINYENIAWLVDRGPLAFDAVVFDEASKMKSPGSQRFKKFKRARPSLDRVWLLTGTPASNGLLDLWALAYAMDMGKRLGRTFTGYRSRFFDQDYSGYNWTPRDGAPDAIHDALRDICLTMTADDYLAMPDRVDTTIAVALPPDARKHYAALERQFLTQIDDATIAVQTAAALSNKLLQCANGAAYTDDSGQWAPLHTAKLDALADLVGETAGAPLLVAYTYQSDLARLRESFPFAETIGDDPGVLDRWNAGQVRMLLAHPASAGHGLNLQRGGHHVVWFGLNWSLELYQQFNARLHRQGQERPVVVHHIIAADTVDQTVMQALDRKDTTQRALLDALKADVTARSAGAARQ